MFESYLHPWDQQKKERSRMSDYKEIGSGGIWIKEGKRGKYLSGSLHFDMMGRRIEVSFVAFKNEKVEGKQPLYRIKVNDFKDPTQPKEAPYQPPKEAKDESIPF